MFSGQDVCMRTEWTAAMEPLKYSASSVMATCTRNEAQAGDPASVFAETGHSCPFRYTGASMKLL